MKQKLDFLMSTSNIKEVKEFYPSQAVSSTKKRSFGIPSKDEMVNEASSEHEMLVHMEENPRSSIKDEMEDVTPVEPSLNRRSFGMPAQNDDFPEQIRGCEIDEDMNLSHLPLHDLKNGDNNKTVSFNKYMIYNFFSPYANINNA